MRLIGLTGNIASGKSTVLAMLRAKGAEVIDADRIVHALLGPGTESSAAVAAAFGGEVRAADGSIDRRRLGAIVFDDPAALARLEAILHPAVGQAVRAEIAARRAAATQPPALVIEAVKLVENRTHEILDELWLVVAAPEVQRQRLITDRGMDPAAATARLAAQPEIGAKLAIADAVLENNGSLAALQAQVDAAWARAMAAERQTP